MCNLFIQHGKYFILQTFRCNQKMFTVLYNFTLWQSLEYIGSFQSDLYVSCHKRKVGVQSGCLFIVITGTDLCNVLYLTSVFAGDQTQLGVHFIAIQSVDHLTAGILQKSGPADIIFLIKTGSQFYQYDNFFSILGCFDQCLYHFTLLRHTIQGHLNGDDIRIFGRFRQQM